MVRVWEGMGTQRERRGMEGMDKGNGLQPIFFDQNTKYLVVYTVNLQTRHVRGERVREPHLRF